MADIEVEIAAYERMQSDLEREHMGKWVGSQSTIYTQAKVLRDFLQKMVPCRTETKLRQAVHLYLQPIRYTRFTVP